MSEMSPEQDPRLTFERDQEEAKQVHASREEQTWSLSVRQATAHADVTEAQAAWARSRAALWAQLAITVMQVRRAIVAAVFILLATLFLADILPEWFQ